MVESKTFTCPNSSCKKTFTTPLKTLNLQQNPTEPYFACPYCLTKIKDVEQEKKEPKPVQTKKAKEGSSGPSKSGVEAGCGHHLGYLSERVNKEQIPDECLVCKSIVECMLKKMHEQ
jgi:hypothetical protein